MRRAPVLVTCCLILALAGTARTAPAPDRLRGEFQARSLERDDARAEAQALRQEIARLDAQLAELRAVEAAGREGLEGKRERLAALNAREAILRAEMGANQTELSRLLGALELYRRDPPPALLITPQSARDAVRAAILIRAVQPELAERAVVFRARAEQLAQLRRTISTVSEDLFTSESALAEGRASLEQALREKTSLERQLSADAVDADRKVQALAQQLRALGVTPRAAGARPAAGDRAPVSMGPPVEGTLVRRFGQASPGGLTSNGMVWRSAPGASVHAPAAGVVAYSGPLKGWGGVLVLDVGGGHHLVLAGLDRTAAASGRPVRAGEVVGAMPGQPAPELYLEVRHDGTPRDPARWLRPVRSAQR